ncbi:MAG: 2-oxo acid dehydrogenase subunit E2 [Phycisphaeraceae bacterium]|nr:MAG: 2-oxo acid dehydrogenase subunit E2 [Phycisphaeraceae bacterium]
MAAKKSSDPNVFILPDLGEGVHEAELISWKVKPGDEVEEHEVVAEMETDKALVEVPSPRAGVIKALYGEPGQILKVGEAAWAYEGESGSSNGQAEKGPVGGRGAKAAVQAEPAEPPESEEREDAGTVVGTMGGELKGVTRSEGRALATPAVRRLARDLGVDIDSVEGSGLAGRVTERDVRAAAEGSGGGGGARRVEQRTERAETPARQAAPEARRQETLATTVSREQAVVSRPSALVPAGDTSRIAFRGVRRTIATRLRQSVDTAVHFTVMDDADVSALDDVRKRVASASGEKVSYLPFVASAVMRALREFPEMNATVDDANEEIVRHGSVHLGIAADSAQGLTVPVIHNADMLGVLELGRHIAELAEGVRNRSIPADRLKGSTFTISNVGSYAGKYATPVINYPEVAILAAGRVYEGVVADKGAIRIAKLMPLSMACDHRCVDGAAAARCLARVVELLQRPEGLLTPARLG